MSRANYTFRLASYFLIYVIYFFLPKADPKPAMGAWPDQISFVRALTDILNGKASDLIERGNVGGGYVTLAYFFHQISGLSIPDTLIYLNKFCYILTIILFFEINLLYAMNKSERNLLRIYFISLATVISVVLSINFTFFSEIPWTHFIATFLVVLFLFLIFRAHNTAPRKQIFFVYVSLSGFILGWLFQTRFMEALIAIIAMGIWGAGFLIFNFDKRKLFVYSISVLIFVGFFLFSVAITEIITHSSGIKFLYFTAVQNDPFAQQLTRLYPETFILKFFQLFVDPNLFTNTGVYERMSILNPMGIDKLAIWRMPILLQAPILLYSLPVIIFTICALVLSGKIKSIFDIRFLLPMLIGSGLLLGYTSVFIAGSPHLHFGYIRDYMAIIWVLALISSPLVLHLFFREWFTNIVPLLVSFFLFVLFARLVIFPHRFLELSEFHVGHFEFNVECEKNKCEYKIETYNPKGNSLYPPFNRSIITVNCDNPSVSTVYLHKGNKGAVDFLDRCRDNKISIHAVPIYSGYGQTPHLPESLKFIVKK